MRTLTSLEPRPRWSAVQVRERVRTGPQPKLTIGAPGDRFEREADHVADEVMRGGAAEVSSAAPRLVQRACAACSEEDKRIRGKPQGTALNARANVANGISDALGKGAPLSGVARTFFGERFGRDFSDVRVHADAHAHALAGSLAARAFTLGRDIFFNEGEYAPGSERGRRLLAHELTHVVQQAHAPEPMVMKQDCPNGNCHDRYRKEVERPFDWTWLQPPDQAELMTKWLQRRPAKRLNFYHGTRWSVAKKIPGNVKAVGGGDFAAGFYTHHDANDKKAWYRALQWACRVARAAKEKYGGVIQFEVDAAKYATLGTTRDFGLTSLDQQDYAKKQAEWLDFVTTYGRQKDPVYKPKRGQWVHERRDPAPNLSYDAITGPFYTPIKGDAKHKPAPSDFDPFAEGRTLPQQVVFANKGIDLLNDPSSTKTDLKQHECQPLTGNIVDPPDESAAAAPGTEPKDEVPMIQ
jgi:hypothetical protein